MEGNPPFLGINASPDWLRRQAQLQPDGLALMAGEDAWTFAQLDQAADALAARLAQTGVAPGDRVAVLAGNRPLYVVLIHALIRRRAVLVPLNLRLAPAELAWQLADCGARWLLHDGDQAPRVAEVCREVGELLEPTNPAQAATAAQGHQGPRAAAQPPQPLALEAVGEGLEEVAGGGPGGPPVPLAGPAEPSPAESLDLSATHCIIYTSGTTGRPKGALLTYGNHFWSAVQSALNLGLHRDDRWLACLPLFHVSGLSIVFRSVLYGIPMVLHRRFDPAAVNHSLDAHRATLISVVATMLQRLLEERGQRPFPPHLRCVLLGGGPAARPLLEACAQRRLPVVQTYGMTETASQFATLAPGDALRKLGSAGKPLFFNQLRILDQQGRPLPPGEVGEIALRGPTLCRGYLNRPDATAEAWRGGWFHTGDLGYVDEEGYLYVVDRRSDLIISGGENVYPAEVEAVLLAHPQVEEAGVVGVPDPQWGQVPVAVVRLRSGADGDPGGAAGVEAALLQFCRERLAAYKVPRRIVVRQQPLPRTASGKLQRRHLIPWVQELLNPAGAAEGP